MSRHIIDLFRNVNLTHYSALKRRTPGLRLIPDFHDQLHLLRMFSK